MDLYPKRIISLFLMSLILFSLSANAQEENLETWIKVLNSGNSEEIEEANQDLANLAKENDELASMLLGYIENPTVEVRKNAIKVVAAVSSLDSVDVFQKHLAKEKNEDVRTEIYMVLLKSNLSAETLKKYSVEAGKSEVRLAAFEKWKSLGQSDLAFLIKLLWDENEKVRSLAHKHLTNATGVARGYNPKGDFLLRVVAIGNWQKWLEEQKLWKDLLGKEGDQARNKLLAKGESILPEMNRLYSQADSSGKVNLIGLAAEFSSKEAIAFLNSALPEVGSVREAAVQGIIKVWEKGQNNDVLQSVVNLMETVSEEDKVSLALELSATKNAKASDIVTAWLAKADVATLSSFSLHQLSLLSSFWKKQEKLSDQETVFLLQSDSKAASDVLLHHFAGLSAGDQLAVLDKLGKEKNKSALEAIYASLPEKADASVVNAVSQHLIRLESSFFSKVEHLEQMKVVFESGSKEIQLVCLNLASKIMGEQAEAFLLSAMNQGSSEKVKKTALDYYLAQKPDNQKATFIFEQLEKSTEDRLKWMDYLSKYVGGKQFDTLATFIRNEKDEAIRTSAVQIAARMNQSSDLLLELVSSDASLAVQKIALEGLEKLKPENLVSKLEEAYKASSSGTTQNTILRILIGLDKTKGKTLLNEALGKEKVTVADFTLLVNSFSEEAAVKFSDIYGKLSTNEEKRAFLEAGKEVLGYSHLGLLVNNLSSDSVELVDLSKKSLKKITNEEPGTEWSTWYQVYTKVEKLGSELLKGDTPKARQEQIQALLSQNKDVATKYLTSVFYGSANLNQKQLILDTISPWNTDKTRAFVTSLGNDENASIRTRAYRLAIEFDLSSLKSQFPILYAMETDSFAKVNLLYGLLLSETSYQSYQGEVRSFLSSSQAKVWQVLNEMVSNNLVKREQVLEKMISQAPSKDLQSKLAESLSKNSHGLVALVSTLNKASTSSEKEKSILAVLSKTSGFPTDACQDLKSFQTWWQNAKSETGVEVKLALALEKWGQGSSVLGQKTLLSQDKAYSAIAKYLQSDRSNGQKERVFPLLVPFVNKDSAAFVAEFLDSDSSSLRYQSIRALAQVGYSEIPDVLTKAYANEDARVRFYATRSFGEATNDSSLELLKEGIEDIDVRVKEEAVYWVTKRNASSEELTLNLLKDRAPSIRAMAIEEAGKLRMKSASQNLLQDLNNPFVDVRRASYKALLAISGRNIAFNPEEENAENRKDSVTEWRAWWAAEKLNEEINELIDTFATEGILVEKVQEKLLSFGPIGVNVLQGRLNDPRGIIRLNVVRSLAAFGQRELALDIAGQVGDVDIRVRESALKALADLTGEKIELTLAESQTSQWNEAVTKVTAWWAGEKAKLEAQKAEKQKNLAETISTLLGTVQTDSSKLAEVSAQLKEKGSSALAQVRSELKNEDNTKALAAARVLANLKDQESVSDIISLLARAGLRNDALTLLHDLMGTSLTVELVEDQKNKVYQETASSWWKDQVNRLYEEQDEKIAQVLSETNPGNVSQKAAELVALGASTRVLLVENLANELPEIRSAIVTALTSLNDPRSISALLPYLVEGEEEGRKSILRAINALAGKILQEKMPEDEAQWVELQGSISKWWSDSHSERLTTQEKILLDAQSDLMSNENRDSKAQELAKSHGLALANAGESFLKKETMWQLAALDVLRHIGDFNSVSSILPLLSSENGEVAQKAAQTIEFLAGSKLPEGTTDEQIWRSKIVLLKSQWTEKRQSTPVDTEVLQQTLVSLVSEGQKEGYQAEASKTLSDMGDALWSNLATLSKAPEDKLRQGAAVAYALVGNFTHGDLLVKSLEDSNLRVRQAASNGLAKVAGAKLPVSYDPAAEKAWQEKKADWLATWEDKEKEAKVNRGLAQLEKDAQSVASVKRLWTLDQVDSAEKVLTYLSNPVIKVKERAAEILGGFTEDAGLSFDPDASEEERADSFKEFEDWLEAIREEILESQADVEEKVVEIEAMRKIAEGNVYSKADYNNVMEIINDHMTEEDNPVVLIKYVEVLEAYGRNLDEYKKNIYDEEKRNDLLYEAGVRLYDEKLKSVEQAEKSGAALKATLGKALQLTKIGDTSDLQTAKALVDALNCSYYPLRKEVFGVLTSMAEDSREYDPKSPSEESLKGWQDWLTEEEQRLAEEAKAYQERVVQTASSLKSILNDEDWGKAALLVGALNDKEDVRSKAFEALKAVAGEDHGFDPKKSGAEQEASVEAWSAWLNSEKSRLAAISLVREIAQSLTQAEAVSTITGVEQVKQLVNALKSPELQIRELAFGALSQYVSKHAQSEVRENFGYEANAPEKLRMEKAEEWNKWYLDKVKPVADAIQAELTLVDQEADKLASKGVYSSDGLEAASKLLTALSSSLENVRVRALAGLEKATGDSYAFDPAGTEEERVGALKSWQWWMNEQLERVNRIRTQQEDLLKKAAAAKKLQSLSDVVAMESILSNLNSLESSVREKTEQLLTDVADKNFAFSDEGARTRVQAWLAAQRNIIEGTSSLLGKKADDLQEGDYPNVKKLVDALTSEYVTVRQYSITQLNALRGEGFGYDAKASEVDREEAVDNISDWFDKIKE